MRWRHQAWNRLTSLAQRCANLRHLKAVHAVLCVNATPSSFAFNAVVRAYARSSDPRSALRHFKLALQSPSDNTVIDHCTFNFVLLACVNGGLALEGRMLHCWVVKNALASSDCHVQTALIRFHVTCKVVDSARKVFDEIPQRDVYHWNAHIDGYVRCGCASEAVKAFRDMLNSRFDPDEHCVTTAIKACSLLGSLTQGIWIHDYVKKRKEFGSSVFIATALVDMYAKCGCLDAAVEVFEKMPKRNEFSWAALIGAFALHGQAEKALHCLTKMPFKPDGVILLGVLTACAHARLQTEGRDLLTNMKSQYGVEPRHEHYSCVVDLLCRAGRLSEAYELIREMPMKPLASVWGALLSGCRIYNNVNLAEVAAKELKKLESEDNNGVCVQMFSIYLAAGRSGDAARVRKMIGFGGASKKPGWSIVEIDGKANEFVSGDCTHEHQTQIAEMLDLVFSGSIRNLLFVCSRDHKQSS